MSLVRCEFEPWGKFRCKCRLCHRLVRSEDCTRVRAVCLTNPEELVEAALEEHYARKVANGTAKINVAQLGWNYVKAIARWKAAGSPVRPQEEIDRIYAICEACPHFSNEKRPHCKLCGCSLSKLPDGLRNKVAMSTESCPDSPPRWTASMPAQPN